MIPAHIIHNYNVREAHASGAVERILPPHYQALLKAYSVEVKRAAAYVGRLAAGEPLTLAHAQIFKEKINAAWFAIPAYERDALHPFTVIDMAGAYLYGVLMSDN